MLAQIAALARMGSGDLVDTLIDADGNTVYYYDDGGVIVYDAAGNYVDSYNDTTSGSGGGGGVTAVNSETDSYGNTVTTYSDGSQVITNPAGAVITGAQESANAQQQIVAASAATTIETVTGVKPQVLIDGTLRLPPGVTQGALTQILAAAARQGSQWLAKQVGGQTVLYRSGSGVGTFDLQKNLPLIIGAGALFLLSKQKGGK